MDKFNNKMYQDNYIENLLAKIIFSVTVFMITLMWIVVWIG